MKPLLPLILLVLLLARPAQAARIADVEFDEAARLGGRELVLNGLGVRQVAWLTGYAAGLYLPQKSTSAAQALAQPGPKRIRLRMLVDVEAKELAKAIAKGVRRNHAAAERAALQPRLDRVERAVLGLGLVRRGDVLDLDLLPGSGLVLTRNGVAQGTPIPGDDLYTGLMKIFIGEVPVDPALKAGLLGARKNP